MDPRGEFVIISSSDLQDTEAGGVDGSGAAADDIVLVPGIARNR